MSLIKCPECQANISDKVSACPYCGYPFMDDSVGIETESKNEVEDVVTEKISCEAPVQAKTMNKRTLAICVLILVFIIGVATFSINTISDKNYIAHMHNVSDAMLTSGATAEELCNTTVSVWNNSIRKEIDPRTDKYTIESYSYSPGKAYYPDSSFKDDFNDSLVSLYSDQSTLDTVTEIEGGKENVELIMKKLNSPPSKFRDHYNVICELYTEYVTLVDMAISPSGSLQSYSNDSENTSTAFMKQFQKLQTMIPEK